MHRRLIQGVVADQTLLTMPPDTTVRKAAKAMKKANVGAVLIVENGLLVGIFTERDALNRVLADGRDPDRTPLAQVMTASPHKAAPDDLAIDALRRMHEDNFRHLPICDPAGRPVGIVSLRDFIGRELGDLEQEIEAEQSIFEHI